MSKAATQRWKNNEKQWSETLQKYGLQATRISRAGNFSESIHDVDIPELPWAKSDTKYSVNGFKESRLRDETEFKYCKERGDTAILITKGYKERGQGANVDAEFLAMLLAYWAGEGKNRDILWAIYTKQTSKETKE